MARDTNKPQDADKVAERCSWLSGIVMIALGCFVWFSPTTLAGFDVYIGLGMVALGVIYLKVYFSWTFGWKLPMGLLSIAMGLIMMTDYGVTTETYPTMIGLWALFLGVIQIASSAHLRNVSFRWSWMLATGFLGVIAAFLIIGYPMLGLVSVNTTFIIYTILYGVMEIVNAAIERDVNIKI